MDRTSRAYLRQLPWFVAAVLVILLLAAILVRVIYVRQEQRAAMLLNAVLSLRPGESSATDIEGIVANYKGGPTDISGLACDPHGPSYIVHIANDALNSMGSSAVLAVLRPRNVNAIFILKNGTLCYVQYSVEIVPGRRLRPVRTNASVTLASETELLPFDIEYLGGNIRSFQVALTSEATPDQHRRAFDFDLSCLARFSGCHVACELMPSAWLDYQKKARAEGRAPRPEELGDPHCKKLTASP
jgi:hypothetical protein